MTETLRSKVDANACHVSNIPAYHSTEFDGEISVALFCLLKPTAEKTRTIA